MRIPSLLLALTLAASAAVTYTYDSAGRLIKVDYGNGSVLTYTYDNAGNLTSRTAQSPAGPVITSVRTAFAGPHIAQNTWTQINGTNLVPASTPEAGVIWSNAPSFASGPVPITLRSR